MWQELISFSSGYVSACLKVYGHGEWRLCILPRSCVLDGQQCWTPWLRLDF